MTDPWLQVAQQDPWLKQAEADPWLQEAQVEQPEFEEISVEPSAEDLEKYRRMGVKQYRSPAGKLYDLREQVPSFEEIRAPQQPDFEEIQIDKTDPILQLKQKVRKTESEIVKDYLGFGKTKVKAKPRDILRASRDEDIDFIKQATISDPFAVPTKVGKLIDREQKIRQEMKSLSQETPAAQNIVFAVSNWTNLFNVNEYLDRKGLNPISKGQYAITLEAVNRLIAARPLSVKDVALEFGVHAPKILLEFAALPDVGSKIKMLEKTPRLRKILLTGLKFATRAAVQAPSVEETLAERTKRVLGAGGFGAAVGAAGEFIPRTTIRAPITIGGAGLLTLAQGGSKEDVIKAMSTIAGFEALGLIKRASRATDVKIRKRLETKAIKAIRQGGEAKGLDLSKVPDEALRFYVKSRKQTDFWQRQFKKGKITQKVLDRRLGEQVDRMRPVLEAIARQQPAQPTPGRPVAPKVGVKPEKGIKLPPKPKEAKIAPKVAPKAPLAHPLAQGKTHQELANMPLKEYADTIHLPAFQRLQAIRKQKEMMRKYGGENYAQSEKWKQLTEEENQLFQVTKDVEMPQAGQQYHVEMAEVEPTPPAPKVAPVAKVQIIPGNIKRSITGQEKRAVQELLALEDKTPQAIYNWAKDDEVKMEAVVRMLSPTEEKANYTISMLLSEAEPETRPEQFITKDWVEQAKKKHIELLRQETKKLLAPTIAPEAITPVAPVAEGKALFIPLKTEHYDKFVSGEKQTEMREEGPRWNDKTVYVGRKVTISKGYGKAGRLTGVVTKTWVEENSTNEDFVSIYGEGKTARHIQIRLEAEEKEPPTPSALERKPAAETKDEYRARIREIKVKVPEGKLSGQPVTVEGKKYYPVSLPTDQISIDAERFQFKLGAKLVGGVTEALKDVERFDPVKGGQIFVWQDKAGKYWVVDGHHRVALAKKTGAESLETWVVSEKDGVTEQDARAIGALRNLADGKGTAVDAAKLFRDSNISLEELRKNAVPTNSTVVQQGLDMADLSDEVFRLVVDERLPANMAAAIGKQVKNPTQQKQVANLILEGEVETLRQAELLAATIDSAPILTKTEQTLFGLETTEKSLYAERAKVLANVEKKLKTNKKVFGVLATQTGIIEAKGNILAKVENLATKEKAEEVLFMLEKLANSKGPVAEALNDATKQYAENPTNENLSKVTSELLERWTEGPGRLRIPERKGVPELPLERAAKKVEPPLPKGVTEIESSIGKIRIPDADLTQKYGQDLETIFDYGNFQRDIEQPDLQRSLSVGDTIKYRDHTLMIMPFGWRDVTGLSQEAIAAIQESPNALPTAAEWRAAEKRLKGKKPKGKPGFIDVRPLAKVHKSIMNIIEPSKAVEIAQGKEAYAAVIKGIHKADVGRIEFNEADIDSLDRSLQEFGELLSKYSKATLTNLMAARGKPFSKGAIFLKNEALKKLAKEAPELIGVRRMITQIADFNYKFLQKVVGDDIHYVEDYFYGIYKDAKKVERFLDYWKTTKRFTKEKKLPTVADALDYGLELRDPNPVNNLRSEYMAIARLDGMIYMRDELLRTGKGKYIDTKEDAPIEWEKVKDPVFKDHRVAPELALLINKLISTNQLRRYPITNALRKANNFLRTVKFMGSAFHQISIAKQSIADEGYLEFIQPSATRGVTLGFRKSDPIFKTQGYRDYIAHGGGHRYSIASEAQRAFTKFVEGLDKKLGILFKVGGLPIRIPKSYVKWMFQSYIPKVKYAKYADRVVEKEKELGRQLTSPEKIDIIKEQQNFYGMMNERLFGRGSTATTILRLWFMAPGYAEGNYRTILKSILQWGGKTGYKASRSRSNIINSLLLSAIAATVGTLILTGKPPKVPETRDDVRDLFKIDTGMVDDKGRKIMIDLLTYDKDYWNILGNVFIGRPDEAVKSAIKRAGGMTAVTAEVALDMANMAAGRAIYDWKGDRVTEITDPFARQVLKIAIHEIKRTEPISVSVFKQSLRRDQTAVLSALTSLLGYRPTLTEKDKREQRVLHRIYSLKGQQEELYQYLASIRNPRGAVERYNKTVDNILSSPMIPQKMRKEWEPKLVIDLDRYLENRAYYLTGQNRTPREIGRAKKILENFGVTPDQAQEYLKKYWQRERKKVPVSPLERDRVIGRTRKRKRLEERMQKQR